MESAEALATNLTLVMKHVGFDGWLVNIENKIDPSNIPFLKHFLGRLRQNVSVSTGGEGSVIWYDSVIDGSGELKWQDTVNKRNRPFFDLADGIFVNYTWKQNTPLECAAVAQDRRADVFMGIDVFGRGTYGGGGMDVDKALRLIKNANVSAALFAPGWVLEQLEEGASFHDKQHQFWSKIEEMWSGPQTSADASFSFFSSSFGQGKGRLQYAQGKCLSRVPWYRLCGIDVQPDSHIEGATQRQNTAYSIRCEHTHELAYNGGSSLRIQGVSRRGCKYEFPLFSRLHINLPVFRTFEVSYTFCRTEESDLCILLSLGGPQYPKTVVLRGSMQPQDRTQTHQGSNEETTAADGRDGDAGEAQPSPAVRSKGGTLLSAIGTKARARWAFFPIDVQLQHADIVIPDDSGNEVQKTSDAVDALHSRGLGQREIAQHLQKDPLRMQADRLKSVKPVWETRRYRIRSNAIDGRPITQIKMVVVSSPSTKPPTSTTTSSLHVHSKEEEDADGAGKQTRDLTDLDSLSSTEPLPRALAIVEAPAAQPQHPDAHIYRAYLGQITIDPRPPLFSDHQKKPGSSSPAEIREQQLAPDPLQNLAVVASHSSDKARLSFLFTWADLNGSSGGRQDAGSGRGLRLAPVASTTQHTALRTKRVDVFFDACSTLEEGPDKLSTAVTVDGAAVSPRWVWVGHTHGSVQSFLLSADKPLQDEEVTEKQPAASCGIWNALMSRRQVRIGFQTVNCADCVGDMQCVTLSLSA
jgi:hypothetical protein